MSIQKSYEVLAQWLRRARAPAVEATRSVAPWWEGGQFPGKAPPHSSTSLCFSQAGSCVRGLEALTRAHRGPLQLVGTAGVKPPCEESRPQASTAQANVGPTPPPQQDDLFHSSSSQGPPWLESEGPVVPEGWLPGRLLGQSMCRSGKQGSCGRGSMLSEGSTVLPGCTGPARHQAGECQRAGRAGLLCVSARPGAGENAAWPAPLAGHTAGSRVHSFHQRRHLEQREAQQAQSVMQTRPGVLTGLPPPSPHPS